jgi:nucleolar protein 6
MGGPNKSYDSTRAERKAKKRKLAELVPDLPGDEGHDGELKNGREDTRESLKKKKKTTNEKESAINERGQSERKNENNRKKIKGLDGDGGTKVGITGGHCEDPNGTHKTIQYKDHKRAEIQLDTAKPIAESEENPQDQEPARKSKKERKAEKRAKEAAESTKNQGSHVLDSLAKANHEVNLDVAATLEKKNPRKNNRNREKKREAAAAAAAAKDKSSTDSQLQKLAVDRPNRFIVFIGLSLSRCHTARCWKLIL